MQAIVTKYHGPTNTKPGRISATSASGLRIMMEYEHAFNAGENHARAARALCDKFGWENGLLGGGLSDSEEVFVMIPKGYQLVEA